MEREKEDAASEQSDTSAASEPDVAVGTGQEPPVSERQVDGANDSTQLAAKTDTSDSASQKNPPGGFDATAMPKIDPGFTVKITFHGAARLPMADLTTLSSDPYVRAEIYTDQPSRHKEDPPLRFRTETHWKTTEPKWEEEWIVGHMPATGFRLKARIYDEDSSDRDDRLGNVHVTVDHLDMDWPGIKNNPFKIMKRSGSWRAYTLRAMAVCMHEAKAMSGVLFISVEVLGQSSGGGRRAYTIGPNYWCRHYSPLLGRIAHSRDPEVSKPEDAKGPRKPTEHTELEAKDNNGDRPNGDVSTQRTPSDRLPQPAVCALSAKKSVRTGKGKDTTIKSGRFNFQANQIQLTGPVPEALYHRFVEFKPSINMLFTSSGLRGLLMNKALHHQHKLVYNYNPSTEYGMFKEPNEDMTRKFLELVRWDAGGRIFTYVITLDSLMRFTETGKEYGIDLLSKHTMHSDADIYVAWSGEFFVHRARHRDRSKSGNVEKHPSQLSDEQRTHASSSSAPVEPQTLNAHNLSDYELIIDNDSGTYRPNGALLPILRDFLASNFPGLRICTLDCQKDGEKLKKMKNKQRERKKREGGGHIVYTQLTGTESSLSSEEERLGRMQADDVQPEATETEQKPKHKLGEAVLPFVNNPKVREQMMTKSLVKPG